VRICAFWVLARVVWLAGREAILLFAG